MSRASRTFALLAALWVLPSAPALAAQPRVLVLVEAERTTLIGLRSDSARITDAVAERVAGELARELPLVAWTTRRGGEDYRLRFQVRSRPAGPDVVAVEYIEAMLDPMSPPPGGNDPGCPRVPRGSRIRYDFAFREWRVPGDGLRPEDHRRELGDAILAQLRSERWQTGQLSAIRLGFSADLRALQKSAVLQARANALHVPLAGLTFRLDVSGANCQSGNVWGRGRSAVPPQGYIEGGLVSVAYGGQYYEELDRARHVLEQMDRTPPRVDGVFFTGYQPTPRYGNVHNGVVTRP